MTSPRKLLIRADLGLRQTTDYGSLDEETRMQRERKGYAKVGLLCAAVLGVALASCQDQRTTAPTSSPLQPSAVLNRAGDEKGIDKVQHVVVIYLESHSFDNLYGEFPGADGLFFSRRHATQIDANGQPYATLPEVAGSNIPTDLPNRSFDIDQYVAATQPTSSPLISDCPYLLAWRDRAVAAARRRSLAPNHRVSTEGAAYRSRSRT